MSDVHPQRHQFGRQSGKAPELALRPPVLDVDVLALGPTEICESSPERVHEVVLAVGLPLPMNPIRYTLPTGCAWTANGAATRVTVPAMKARRSIY